MRLLLTHGYFLSEDPKEQQIMRPYPPLGLLYLSSYLRGRGHEVDLYDSTFGSRAELEAILAGEPGIVGVYANLMTRGSAVTIVEQARAHGWVVVAGGPEPANYADEYLDAGAHYVVPGEGERVLDELLGGNPLPNGVVCRALDRSTVRTPPMEQIPDLDSLPWPDRERIDIERYLAAWRRHHGAGSVSLITARGCPYHCTWCSHSTFGKTHRRRKPEAVAAEVEWIAGRYNPEQLWYADDVFTIHPGWLAAFAVEMKRRRVRIPFECITRADRLDDRSADLLAALGCFRVWIGSESGSQRILDAMRRGVTTGQVHRAVDVAKARGIETGMFLMWGFDGEDRSDIEATVDHVRTCRPDVLLTTVSYPIKGTPYFDQVSGRIDAPPSWRHSTDRDLRIRGRHSRRYFQFADELLRASVGDPANEARIAAARAGLAEASAEVEA